MTVTTLPVSLASVFKRHGPRGLALRNLVWLSSDKLVSVVLGLVVFGLIARYLGPQGAGSFSYSAAVLQATLGLSLVCSSAAVLPRLCRLDEGAAARAVVNVFTVRLFGSVLAALVVAAYVAVAVDDPLRRNVTLLLVATVPLLEPFSAFAAYWASRNLNGPPVTTRALGLLLRLAVVLAALWAGAPVWVVALGWVAEALLTASLQTLLIGTVRPWRILRRAVQARRALPYLRFGVRFAVGLWLAHLFLRLDRLWLAEWLPAHEFGLYATAMQLVEVWLQVAMLMAGSMAPAFLYRSLMESRALVHHRKTLALLAAMGLAGLAGAALLGRLLLAGVYGPAFAGGYGYLVAGFAAAVLFFIDQFVQVSITANNRPGLLALKWGAACGTAVLTLWLATPVLGAYSGPLGLALGMLASWLTVATVYGIERNREVKP